MPTFRRESTNEGPELSSVGSAVGSERDAIEFFLVRSIPSSLQSVVGVDGLGIDSSYDEVKSATYPERVSFKARTKDLYQGSVALATSYGQILLRWRDQSNPDEKPTPLQFSGPTRIGEVRAHAGGLFGIVYLGENENNIGPCLDVAQKNPQRALKNQDMSWMSHRLR